MTFDPAIGRQLAGYPEDTSCPTFDKLSTTSSAASESRSRSPSPEDERCVWDDKTGYHDGTGYDSDEETESGSEFVGIGLLPDDVYDEAMNSWRSSIRSRIRKNVEWESLVLARMQVRPRSPFHTLFVLTVRRNACARRF